jgi:HJR/Mrr/RecB family endonuclease
MALTVKHLFPFFKLMKALNIREDFKALMKNKISVEELADDDKSELLQERGIDLIFTLMEKMPNAEKEIKSFLALYAEKTLDEIEAMSPTDFIELIKQFFAEPEFKSFFKQAVK